MYRLIFSFLFLILTVSSAAAAPPPSSINLTIDASAADLAAIVNQSLPKALYNGKGALGASVSVVRTAPVTVTAADDFLYLTLPVQVTFGYAMYDSYPIRTALKFKARVNLTQDWRLKTELYYTGLSAGLADTMKVGPLSLKPKSMIEGVTEPVQRLIAPLIDSKVNDAVQLRPKVAQIWQHAFAPVQVSKEFGAWLKLEPEKVVVSPLSASNNRIELCIGIVSGAEITVGPKPAPAPARPLPPVQLLRSFDKTFRIQLGTDIFFADLVHALEPVLLGKTFGDDKKITVKGFDLKGKDGRLMVVLSSTGAFDGELTVLAKPVFNPKDNSLGFEDVDFDTHNAGWLISAGSWLFSSTIRNTIKTKLDATVTDQLEKARVKASAALASVPIADHVKLTGAVNALHLGEPVVLNDRLSLSVIAQGESSVHLK